MKRNPSTLPACLAGGLAAGLLFGSAMCLILYAMGELFTWKLIPFIAAVSIGDSLFLGYALHVFLQKFTDAGVQRRRLKDLWADKAFRRLVAAPCLLVLLVVGLTCAAGVLRRAYSTPLVFIPLFFILILTTSHYKPADPQPCRITFGKPRPLPALLKGLAFSAVLFAACIAYFGAVHMLPLWLGIVLAVGGVVNGLMLGAMLSLAESLQVTAIATARHEPRDETSTLNIEH